MGKISKLLLIFIILSSFSLGSINASASNENDNSKKRTTGIDIDFEIEKASKELSELKRQLSESKVILEGLTGSKISLESEIGRVEKAANLTVEKIQDVNNKIIDLKSRLDILYVEIAELELELSKRESLFRDRIKSSSKVSYSSYFEFILKSESFSDMLNRFNNMKRIVHSDNNIIEEYLDLSERLYSKRTQQESLKVSLEQSKEELEDIRLKLIEENKVNGVELKSVESDYDTQLNVYKNLSIKLGEVESLYKELEVQKDLMKNFKTNITVKTGDFNLHPLIEYKRKELIALSREKGLKLITTSGLRSFSEQDRLYSQGRGDSGGSVVTNARGGQSWHNYGLSFDVAFDNGHGVPTWDQYDMNGNGIDDWTEIGEIGVSIGLEWGGNWVSFVDRPHFQYTFNKSMSEIYSYYVR